MNDPSKTVSLITGANKGIGFEIARKLGARGHTVLVGSRDKKRGRNATDQLKSAGIDAHLILLDVTHQADLNGDLSDFKLLGYGASKTAVNAVTIYFAHELRDTPIKVNSACPGWVKTDMGGPEAPGTADQGADTPAWLATLPPDGP